MNGAMACIRTDAIFLTKVASFCETELFGCSCCDWGTLQRPYVRFHGHQTSVNHGVSCTATVRAPALIRPDAHRCENAPCCRATT